MRKIFKGIVVILAIPFIYLILSLITSYIPVNREFVESSQDEYKVFLHTNGVHLDIAFQKKYIPKELFKKLHHTSQDEYISFGWGEENFYLNTPEWKDLTFKNAVQALFMKSPSLMHVTRYKNLESDWIGISISAEQHQDLLKEISQTFQKNRNQEILILPNTSYSTTDEFYKANGNYHIFNTCNSWVNQTFKKSGLKACLWTPFDFALLNKYN